MLIIINKTSNEKVKWNLCVTTHTSVPSVAETVFIFNTTKRDTSAAVHAGRATEREYFTESKIKTWNKKRYIRTRGKFTYARVDSSHMHTQVEEAVNIHVNAHLVLPFSRFNRIFRFCFRVDLSLTPYPFEQRNIWKFLLKFHLVE